MKISRIAAVYFSATGTTQRSVTAIAKELATCLGLPLRSLDFTSPTARQTPLSFSEDELVVFGTPVYAGRVPNLLLPYLSSIQGGGAFAVPVVLYGNRAFDDALMELRNLLEKDSFRCIAGAAFIGEHSFGHVLSAGRPDQNDLTHAAAFAREIAQTFLNLDPHAPHVPVAVPGNEPVGPYYRPTDAAGNFIDIRKVKPKTSDTCVKCTWCAKHCPMGSISLDDPQLIPGICIKCNACVKGCPKEAKYFDDPGYLFHRDDIAARFSLPRKEPSVYW